MSLREKKKAKTKKKLKTGMMGVKMECKKLYERCKKTPICTKIDITLANTSHYFFQKTIAKITHSNIHGSVGKAVGRPFKLIISSSNNTLSNLNT